MNAILADVFALYVKTKNFHWHMSGPHFRDYHLLLDEQADQLFAMTDPSLSAFELGGITLRSIARSRGLSECSITMRNIEPLDMLAELAKTTKSWPRACARRTTSARNTATSPRPV
jgi:starvation-inducible DNA-binding protein